MKMAFLVIDMQAVHVRDIDPKTVNRACEYINHVSELTRSNGHAVIHIQDIEGMNEANKESYATIPEVQMGDNDLILTKEHSNSFWKTALEQTLSDQGVELVVLAGNAAEHCVLFTYNGAIERGFTPVLLQNGILSSQPEAIAAAYRDRNLVSYPVINYLVK
ncbi:cysteine hydrolase family protein [Paenibacillus sacheonensis]|uniref:Isochorismatase family protein n=1 Tax=Paenibacillus sacheonensis TaxID=742054 RepID=A0A7X4YXS4_9BACL|nr:isochorismatase family cysteine hydrolase [Paenibacillus sacheonensis]MBM7566638.1 nicotinamidase-related amidase [Paenibacillus sacheonensis]NBC73554.1 isochorismatase family protein [Paenibacillus sacheonensis]